jgi:biotin operon repressor
MSNHLISAVYKRDLRTPMRKSVMALLADKASDDGAGIYASKQTMADELCCSKQAVLDTIKALMAEGLLIELGTRRAPNGHTIEYGIVVDALDALPLVKCHADREERQRNRSTAQTGQRAVPVKKADRSTLLTPPVKQIDPNPPEPSPSPNASHSPKIQAADEPRLLPEHVLEAWNEMAGRLGLSKARMNDQRRQRLRVLIRNHPIDDFTDAIGCVERNRWMHGENDRGWRADFDFLLQAKSFTRLVEGSYDRSAN